MTTLKPIDKNFSHLRLVPYLNCRDWARDAIVLERNEAEEGFRNFSSGSWMNFINYKHINKDYPTVSKSEAIEEMIYYKQKLKEEIIEKAVEVDEMLMRLAKMEQELNQVIEQKRIDDEYKD